MTDQKQATAQSPESTAAPVEAFELPTVIEFDRDGKTAIAESGWLGKIIDRCGIVFAVGIVCSMVILIQEIVLRYMFGSPTIWAHETTVFLCAISFVYGGLYCTARDQHIRVVLVYDYVSEGVRRVLDIAISIVSMIASLFFAWAAWLMVKRAIFRPDGSVHFETSGSAWDPAYPAWLKLFLLATLCIMAMQFLILAWNHARKARTNASKTDVES